MTGQQAATAPPPVADPNLNAAIRFYELDHRLTKEDRITLRDYFKSVTNKTYYTAYGLFALGFGLVYFRNRRAIAQATANVKKAAQDTNLSRPEVLLRAKARNNFGVKGTLTGLAFMVFGTPVCAAVYGRNARENLRLQEEAKSTGGSGAVHGGSSSDDGGFDDGSGSYAGGAGSGSGSTVLQVADFLSGQPAFKWNAYYELTIQKPDLAIKDPRKQIQQRMQQIQQSYQALPLPPQQKPQGSAPSNSSRSRIPEQGETGYSDGNASGTGYSVGSVGDKSYNDAPGSSSTTGYGTNVNADSASPQDYTPAGRYSNTFPHSSGSTGSDDGFDDISSLGLPAGSASEQKDESAASSYGSAWDRIRAQNGYNEGSSGGSGAGSGTGSSWDEIKRKSN